MNASSKIRSKTAHGDCCSTVKRGTDQYGNGVCIMPRRPTCSETIDALKPYCRLSTKKRRHLFCSFKNTTMSLTSAIAMTRENALLERSTESNQAHRPIGIELSDASAEFESSTRSGGALCWERANGESETPVVSLTSFGCPGPAIVTTTSKVAKSISQYSVSTSVLAEPKSPDVGSRSDVRQVRIRACFARFHAILTRFPHIAFSATFFIVCDFYSIVDSRVSLLWI